MAGSDPKAPPAPPKDHAVAERLDSWKEIAAYLGRDIRTVQRWEPSKHLPVHRLGEGKRAPIYAVKAELDDWRRGSAGLLNNERRRYSRLIPLAVGSAVILGIALWQLATRRSPHVQFDVVPLSTYPGVQRQPTLSPDGSQVAFVWDGGKPGPRDLYVQMVGEAQAQRVVAGPLRSPEWSPDGRQIAFLRGGMVNVVSPRGGAARALARAISATWVPDGKSLVIEDADLGSKTHLYSLNPTTGERKELTKPADEGYGDSLGRLSPDGRYLAFFRRRSGFGRDLYVTAVVNGAAEGRPRRLTYDSGLILGFAWTATGREIVYSSDLGGRRALWRMAVSPGAEPQRIPGTDDAGYPAIRDSRLAFEVYTQDRNIWGLDMPVPGHPATPAALVIDSTADDHAPQFSPDGARLLFVSDRSSTLQIWVSDSAGRQPVQVTHFATHVGTPRWSADGGRIVFHAVEDRAMQVFVINADGAGLIRLMPGSGWDVRASWSQDGRWIYFRSTRSGSDQIWKVPSTGGNAVQLTRGGGFEPFEAPDGKLVYYAKSWGPDGIWSVPAGGGDETLVLDRVYPNYWAVADRGIYYLDFAARADGPLPLMFYDFATRRRTELARINGVQRTNDPSFTVTRDGRRVMWAQIDRIKSNLMMIEDFR